MRSSFHPAFSSSLINSLPFIGNKLLSTDSIIIILYNLYNVKFFCINYITTIFFFRTQLNHLSCRNTQFYFNITKTRRQPGFTFFLFKIRSEVYLLCLARIRVANSNIAGTAFFNHIGYRYTADLCFHQVIL